MWGKGEEGEGREGGREGGEQGRREKDRESNELVVHGKKIYKC